MILNRLRNSTFWLIDFIKGNNIRKAYNNLEKHYKTPSNSTKLKKYHAKSIERLLEYATINTPFYYKYDNKSNLDEFPVINKKIIQNNQKKFLSKTYDGKDLIKMSTSGSTGSPFTSYQNIEKKQRVNAETIFFNGKAGYQVGESLINLRSLNIKSQKSKIKQFLQNENLIDVKKLDKAGVESLLTQIKKIKDKQNSTILSYASTYDAIYSYYKKYNISIIKSNKINGVISTSEILSDKTRDFISEIFNCNCYSRYANMENGMLGQDIPSYPNTFILNETNYFIEILKLDSNQAAELGEVGRIVVTDLYNYAMPMIRYDTGDIGAFTYVDVDGIVKKAITNFGGRQIDMIYDVKGMYISPHKISVSFWGYNELIQFQFIQESKKDYRVRLIIKKSFYREKELKDQLKEILGNEANVKFEYVEEIPVLDSGKIKYIMNATE